MRRVWISVLLGACVFGCGDDVEQAVGATGATYSPVRSSTQPRRVRFGESLSSEGLGRLFLDSGPQMLVDDAEIALHEDHLELRSGRAFVDVLAGDSLDLRVGEHRLLARDAAWSVTHGGVVYVIRGELAHYHGEGHQRISAGERLDLASSQSAPMELWEDWTGGLARPGPGLSRDVAIGALEARVPDELGQARWPLVVRRLDVRVRVVEDLAITEVEEEFFNPASETVEGIYRVRVPRQAVLQRFAVDRDGRMVDGYVREKAQARQAYEQQVYRGSTLDPALLEWVSPGSFKARIYPIAPGETRRIAIRYAEWLERPHEGGNRVYRFPMAAAEKAPQIQELSFEADLSEAQVARIDAGFGAQVEDNRVILRRSDFRPRSDFVMELVDAEERSGGQRAWRARHEAPPRDPRIGSVPDEDTRDYVYVPLMLPDSVFGEPATGLDVVIVADVSAATEPSHLELGRSVVESLTAHLGEHDRVAIVASDVGLRPLGEDAGLGPVSSDRVESLLDALAREPAGGATDIGAALSQAAEKLDPSRQGLVVYIGDGAPTVGELGADALLERVERLAHPLRSYAIAVGAEAQLGLLEAVTQGGGLALRVESRAAAAEAALDVLAHARHRVAQRVTVELEGVDQLFPRRPADVVQGRPLAVVARVEGDLATDLVVRGVAGGREFEERIALTETRLVDQGDLRMRWAARRLHQLLLGGAQRAEIADLGIRYGLITPFTSFYVPSAAELASLGPAGAHLFEDVQILARRRSPVYATLLAPAAAFLGLSACDAMSPVGNAEPPETQEEEVPEWLSSDNDGDDEGGQGRRHRGEEGAMGSEDMERTRNRYGIEGEQNTPGAAADAPPPPAAQPSTTTAQLAPAEPEPEPELASEEEAPEEVAEPMRRASGSRASSSSMRSGGGGGLDATGSSLLDSLAQDPAPDRDEADNELAEQLQGLGYMAGEDDGEERDRFAAVDESQLRNARPRGAASGASAGGVLGVLGGDIPDLNTALASGAHDLRISIRYNVQSHRPRRCSDAADLLLDRRRELWRERLNEQGNVSSWIRVYRQAQRSCELPEWSDRRALLELILNKAGSIATMVEVYHLFDSSGIRRYLRRAILRRVRTPDDLRIVRNAFGPKTADDELIEQVLARAANPVARIAALRRLVEQLPYHLDLKLRLLEELEKAGRVAELRRLATKLRIDPLTDAGIRTAIGEMFLRQGDESEARRVFSEIVEFAPQDALARRRLGDLYRAHGWFEDAYRQYQTLANIVPDDQSVLLLLAQAAGGAGRIDEALRLEQRLAETAEPGSATGIARVALLWSSVRFAELRAAARDAGHADELEALASRMRRSGVLAQAQPLRVTLVWSHPEAGLSLWASHPGLGLTRPRDIAPELGLEAFEVEEQEAGAYRFEVRRAQTGLSAVEGKLVVLWNEGAEGEQVRVIPIRFEGETQKLGWTLQGQRIEEVSP